MDSPSTIESDIQTPSSSMQLRKRTRKQPNPNKRKSSTRLAATAPKRAATLPETLSARQLRSGSKDFTIREKLNSERRARLKQFQRRWKLVLSDILPESDGESD